MPLNPNPAQEDIEAYTKRVKALKRKIYDEISQEVTAKCSNIYSHHLTLAEGRSVNIEDMPRKIPLGKGYEIQITVDDTDFYAITQAGVTFYSDEKREALPKLNTYIGVMEWFTMLCEADNISTAWRKERNKKLIREQYGALLKEFELLGLKEDVPPPFETDKKVGDMITIGGTHKPAKIVAIDTDSAIYHLEEPGFPSYTRYFWEIKELAEVF